MEQAQADDVRSSRSCNDSLLVGLDLREKRVLIFIVAYNAETTIGKVLSRIPPSLHSENVEILIIDDFSRDETFRLLLHGALPYVASAEIKPPGAFLLFAPLLALGGMRAVWGAAVLWGSALSLATGALARAAWGRGDR